MPITPSGAQVWRDYVTDGVPASGAHKVLKNQIRAWSQSVESVLDSVLTAAAIFDTRASLFSTLTYAANTLAWVVADSTAAYNGIYRKSGASGTGSWARVADLPYSFIVASDVGAGTPNAIQATSSIPISESALVILNVFEANTGSPVTVSFNGGAALTVKTNTGNDVSTGGLVSGMRLLGVVSGSTFRLVSDQVASAVVAQAEAAAESAEYWAGIATGAAFGIVPITSTGDGETSTLTLSVNPGLASNVIVSIDGILQKPGEAFTVSGTTLTWSNPPADGLAIFGFIITATEVEVGIPSDGAVTEPKLANGAVSKAKLAAGSVDATKIDAAAVSAIQSLLGIDPAVSFSANKNSTNQTGIAAATKLTFGTEEWDVGGYYDPTQSRWTPPAGKYEISAAAYFSAGVADQDQIILYIYKNGSAHRISEIRASGAAPVTHRIVAQVEADGDDYFEVYALASGSNKTVSGSPQYTYFQGKRI